MKDGIKSISLDDIGEMQENTLNKPQGAMTSATSDMLAKKSIHYNPQYADSVQGTRTAPLTRDNFNSSASAMRPLPDGSTFSSAFSRISGTFAQMDQPRKRRLYFLAGGFIITLAGVFLLLGNDDSSSVSGVATMPVAEPKTPASLQVTKEPPPAPAPAPAALAPASPANEAASLYGALPNPLEVSAAAEGSLSKNQEGRFRDGLNHPFTYQRFKTVQDIRLARLKGSEFVLNDAIGQSKFWTRMEAVLGLAEIGQEIDTNTFAAAVGDARPALVKNYFRRFRAQADGSALYVMRQALRVVDPGAREVIIQNLALHRDPINELYLIAASHDPHLPVQALAAQELQKLPAAPQQLERYQALASGEEKRPEPPPKDAQLSPVNVKEMKVEEVPAEVNVEEVYFLNEESSPQNSAKPVPKAK